MDVLKYADINPDDAKHMAQRLHRKKDDLNFVRKVFTIDKVEAIDEERSIVARVSTNDRDRDGEVVEPKGIDLSNYTKNPCLLWAHRYDMPAIGKALWSKTDDKGLICKFQFAPTQFADEIYQLYKGGYQRAFSIGFIPMDFDSVEKVHRKVSLLEVSAVPVPANQDALVLEAYQKGMIKSDQLMQDLNVVMTPVLEKDTTVCEKDTDNKILDADNNPSVSDLFVAIANALNPPAPGPEAIGAPPRPWYAVQDVFPVDFPNGHCIFVECLAGQNINPSYRQDYAFSDGRATMTGERIEVVVAYREKSAEVITKPETKTEEAPAPDLAGGMASIQAGIDAILARLQVTPEPVQVVATLPAPPPIVPEEIVIEAGPDIEIEPSVPDKSYEDMLEAYIKSGDFKRAVNEAVTVALAKIRGKVI